MPPKRKSSSKKSNAVEPSPFSPNSTVAYQLFREQMDTQYEISPTILKRTKASPTFLIERLKDAPRPRMTQEQAEATLLARKRKEIADRLSKRENSAPARLIAEPISRVPSMMLPPSTGSSILPKQSRVVKEAWSEERKKKKSSSPDERTSIQEFKKGGLVKKTGVALVHRGELVIPANKVVSVDKALRKAGMKPLKK